MWDDDDDNLPSFSIGKDPIYFYRVYESVNTFEEGKRFSDTKDFRIGSVAECRTEAVKYYTERLEGFLSGKVKFHYPFESPDNFKEGKNAAYSLVIYIVEYYDENNFYEYALAWKIQCP